MNIYIFILIAILLKPCTDFYSSRFVLGDFQLRWLQNSIIEIGKAVKIPLMNHRVIFETLFYYRGNEIMGNQQYHLVGTIFHSFYKRNVLLKLLFRPAM